mgnify:CR=1 FL=1
MEEDAVKNSEFEMSGTIDSGHTREEYSGNKPEEKADKYCQIEY